MTKPTVAIIPPEAIKELSECVVKIINEIDWNRLVEKCLERPMGMWVKLEDDQDTFVCSNCGENCREQPTCMGEPMYLYCPMCGAYMGKQEPNNAKDPEEEQAANIQMQVGRHVILTESTESFTTSRIGLDDFIGREVCVTLKDGKQLHGKLTCDSRYLQITEVDTGKAYIFYGRDIEDIYLL